MYIWESMVLYTYNRCHNKVFVPFLLPFRFTIVLQFLLLFVTVYNHSVLPYSVN